MSTNGPILAHEHESLARRAAGPRSSDGPGKGRPPPPQRHGQPPAVEDLIRADARSRPALAQQVGLLLMAVGRRLAEPGAIPTAFEGPAPLSPRRGGRPRVAASDPAGGGRGSPYHARVRERPDQDREGGPGGRIRLSPSRRSKMQSSTVTAPCRRGRPCRRCGTGRFGSSSWGPSPPTSGPGCRTWSSGPTPTT